MKKFFVFLIVAIFIGGLVFAGLKFLDIYTYDYIGDTKKSLDKFYVSGSIKDLESRGYLFCNTNRMKRYQSPLELTEQGKLLAARIEAKVNHVLSIASKGLSAEERQMMYHCLETIDQNLQSICNQYDK